MRSRPRGRRHLNLWMVNWYDTSADATYEVQVSSAPATPYGVAISEDNLAGARAFAALAGQLVPLR